MPKIKIKPETEELEEDEPTETQDQDKDILTEEQYEEYLNAEKERLNAELKKLEDSKRERHEVSMLPERVKKTEEAISELQKYVKVLWEKKK